MESRIDVFLAAKLKFFSRILGAVVFLIGFFAVCGWNFDIEIFKRIAPGLPVIAPNTAFSFVLVGLFVLLLNWARENHKPVRAYVGFFSLLVAILGLATLAEYIFKLNLGIDVMLFSGKMGANVIRMSPQSAFNFLMVGLALFFYSLKEKKYIFLGQISIIAAGITALVSLLGFVYGVAGLYTIAPFKGMAVHTAAAFALTFLGILTIRPETGVMRIFITKGLSGMASRRLLFALISILVIEVLVMFGGRSGAYDFAHESLFHLLIVTGVFVFLIFYSFRSLDQLAEAEKTMEHLKEVDEAKTEFVSLASHQLRTPLTSVSWFSEMLAKQEVGPLNPKQEEYLLEILTQNQRMIDLVDDLLNSSRVDMGMLQIEPKPTDLRELVGSVLGEMEPLIREKDIQIEKYFSKNLPKAHVDPEFARIVFQNLVSNAVKYTPKGGKVSVNVAQSGSRIDIKVADTGYGIPKAQQSRVFTKMFRADNIRDKVTDGTGLGLYITKAIVKESGGKIHFDSEEGRGTTFFVTFPTKKRKSNH